jgi:hypothetical protein
MKLHPHMTAPLLAALAMAGSAQAENPPAPRQSCFHASNVSSFRAVDDRTVLVRVGVRDVYQFEIMGRCPDINWAEQIGIVARGGAWICSGLDADLVSPSSIGPQKCPVKALRKLTPQEVAALPKKARP